MITDSRTIILLQYLEEMKIAAIDICKESKLHPDQFTLVETTAAFAALETCIRITNRLLNLITDENTYMDEYLKNDWG